MEPRASGIEIREGARQLSPSPADAHVVAACQRLPAGHPRRGVTEVKREPDPVPVPAARVRWGDDSLVLPTDIRVLGDALRIPPEFEHRRDGRPALVVERDGGRRGDCNLGGIGVVAVVPFIVNCIEVNDDFVLQPRPVLSDRGQHLNLAPRVRAVALDLAKERARFGTVWIEGAEQIRQRLFGVIGRLDDKTRGDEARLLVHRAVGRHGIAARNGGHRAIGAVLRAIRPARLDVEVREEATSVPEQLHRDAPIACSRSAEPNWRGSLV